MKKRFYVSLSFPGEKRDYVSQVANYLSERLGRDRIFYDRWYSAELAVINLDLKLQTIYHDESMLVVPFLCSEYDTKEWCGLEWRAIKDLIKKKQSANIMLFRFDEINIPGLFGTDGYIDASAITPKESAELILKRVPIANSSSEKKITKIISDRLPTVGGDFFGRAKELELLNTAWLGNETRIIQFVAPGGTGKTKLLRHWINNTPSIDILIAWSFYSQGSSEDKQSSASQFFTHAFKTLDSDRLEFESDEDKGHHLAEILQKKQAVIVLDGLEPLQYASRGMRGELRDLGIRQLLKDLSNHFEGLCIVTTRIEVYELTDRSKPEVISHKLANLDLEDGVNLLKSLGVKGRKVDIENTVNEYGHHALALHMLGNVLRLRHLGHIGKRDTLTRLVKQTGDKNSRHAFRVMQQYEEWFREQPELLLLKLLGLFDHPVNIEVLEVLWKANVKGLTDNVDRDDWLDSIANLREEHQLLSQREDSTELDCHPLIREYFGMLLKEEQPEVAKAANLCLYHYYKALPEKLFDKYLPDTLEEMQPLFRAVSHGCAAGLHDKALHEIYWPRLKREKQHYLTRVLGAYNDDLAVISSFFSKPWTKVVGTLSLQNRASVFSWAGFRLRGLGRFEESIEPIQENIAISISQKSWSEAYRGLSNLRSIMLAIGKIDFATKYAKQGIQYAEISGSNQQHASALSGYANVLHQKGMLNKSYSIFLEAEAKHPEKILGGMSSYWFCDLLISLNKTDEVFRRVASSMDTAINNEWILNIALDNLILGRAYQKLNNFERANEFLNSSVRGLRASRRRDYLPAGLLALANLLMDYKNEGKKLALSLLEEVYSIAEHDKMLLHLTDYHIAMARLECQEYHIEKAKELIKVTGYDLRNSSNDRELL